MVRYIRESKQDEEKFRNAMGDELTDKFLSLRNKLSGNQKDYYYWIKKGKEELSSFLDEYQSNTELKAQAKKGAKLITEENGWKVYKINTWEAATFYGRNTTWCICGTKPYRDGSLPQENFKKYNQLGDLYFYIKGDKKICVTYFNKGYAAGSTQIYDEKNDLITFNELPKDLPDISKMVGDGYPKLVLDDEVKMAKQSLASFDYQHDENYIFMKVWWTSGEVQLTKGLEKVFNILLDNGYSLIDKGEQICLTKTGRSNMDIDDLKELSNQGQKKKGERATTKTEFKDEVEEAEYNLRKFWDEGNNSFIVVCGVQTVSMDDMDNFEILYENGYVPYYCDDPSQGELCLMTKDERYGRYSNMFTKLSIEKFFTYID